MEMKTDLSKNSKIRRSVLLLCILCMSFFLGACSGTQNVSVKNSDGTKTRISFENHGVLTRAPVFTSEGNKVTMQFNGTEWYIVRAIGKEEAKSIEELELLSKSSNITIYRNEEDEWYGYIYLLKLEGSEDAYIKIDSMDAPDHHGYGTDFNYFINYYVDGVETVPDMEWEDVK